MKLRLEIHTGPRAFSFEHEGATLRIGRDPHCELCLSEKFEIVSWQHARIDLRPGGATLTDLDSTNGTFLNDHKLQAPARLRAGDEIRLGQSGPTLTVAELHLGKSAPAGPAPHGRRRRRRRYLFGLAGLAVLCVLMLCGTGYYVFRHRRANLDGSENGGKGQDEQALRSRKADAFLRKYCFECHGGKHRRADLDVLDRALLEREGYVVAGDLDKSELWQQIEAGKMPPKKSKLQPTDAEKEDLKQWILHGAPAVVAGRDAHREVIAAIHAHLDKLPAAELPFQRYFVLTHWAGTPKLQEAQPRLWAGLARLLNSLSWQPAMVLPDKIDARGFVYHIDLRQFAWDAGSWVKIAQRYPYGLDHAKDADEPTAKKAAQIYQDTQTPVPFVRADWFLAEASQPPLYHDLLALPTTLAPLEAKLGVDFRADFVQAFEPGGKPRLRRAGFRSQSSGIAAKNRLIERHPTGYGAYWKSYDFRSDVDRRQLTSHPLGPLFPGHPAPTYAFEHDGGEILFNLPNGLQGYLLVNANDERIDKGPPDIVSDKDQPFNTPFVINGLSCIYCHKRGMKENRDQIRAAAPAAVRGPVEKLYPVHAEMAKLQQQDEQRFLKAAALANQGFLPAGASPDDEPVGESVHLFLQSVGAEEVARELSVGDADAVRLKIKDTPRLQELGLGPLAAGQRLERAQLELRRGPFAAVQELAKELGVGAPVRVP